MAGTREGSHQQCAGWERPARTGTGEGRDEGEQRRAEAATRDGSDEGTDEGGDG